MGSSSSGVICLRRSLRTRGRSRVSGTCNAREITCTSSASVPLVAEASDASVVSQGRDSRGSEPYIRTFPSSAHAFLSADSRAFYHFYSRILVCCTKSCAKSLGRRHPVFPSTSHIQSFSCRCFYPANRAPHVYLFFSPPAYTTCHSDVHRGSIQPVYAHVSGDFDPSNFGLRFVPNASHRSSRAQLRSRPGPPRTASVSMGKSRRRCIHARWCAFARCRAEVCMLRVNTSRCSLQVLPTHFRRSRRPANQTLSLDPF